MAKREGHWREGERDEGTESESRDRKQQAMVGAGDGEAGGAAELSFCWAFGR